MNIKTVELEFKKDTDGIGLIDITRPVEHSIIASEIQNGIVTIHSEDPNVCVTTMEFEPGTMKDIRAAFNRLATPEAKKAAMAKKKGAPERQDARPVLIGPSITIPFKDNRIVVGKWQEIILMDFDGIQNRKKIVVQVMGE
jgi:secondary thiamine-phosphate synthase enzyme